MSVRARGLAAVLLGAAMTCVLVHAQTAPSATLLVLSKQDHTLAIVDPGTLKVLARAPVGDDPHEVIASTDGSTAYVSNYGGGTATTIAVIDLAAQKPLPSIQLEPLHGPHGLTFVAGKLWFTAEGSKVIARYDPAMHKVDWVLGTGQDRTHMIYVSEDLSRIVTTNVSSGTVSLIEKTEVRGPGGPPPGSQPPGQQGPPGQPPGPPPGGARKDWTEYVIPVGGGAEGFDVSLDGREIWVANAEDGTVSILDVAARKVIQTLKANVPGANRLKFTPDGSHVLVSTLRDGDLLILDAHTRREITRLPIGHGAAGIVMEPGGARAFVACTPDNQVAVIDLRTLTVAGRLDAGGEPDGMAWAVRR